MLEQYTWGQLGLFAAACLVVVAVLMVVMLVNRR